MRPLIDPSAPPDSGPARRPQIQLRSLIDIWRRAERIIDASLPGILHQTLTASLGRCEIATTIAWP
jgi:hypothetical protein